MVDAPWGVHVSKLVVLSSMNQHSQYSAEAPEASPTYIVRPSLRNNCHHLMCVMPELPSADCSFDVDTKKP